MLAKLLALLAQSKGAAAAVVLLAGATTATVAATNPDVQTTFQELTNSSNLSQQSNDCDHGQPVVVAQRNAADKLLRDAYQKDHQALEDLRGKGADNALIRQYDDQLRNDLNTGLNKVAGLTLGRDGQNRVTNTTSSSGSPALSASPNPSASAGASANANTTCAPSTASSASPSPKPSASAASATSKPDALVTVADRTTLDANIQAIVDATIAAMETDVSTATTALKNASAAPNHGKPNDNPGNKASDAGRPSGTPSH